MKTVHWQLPFAAVDRTKYRIDIYAEGAPTDGVKILVGAATPFTTDEDNSDDFFAPVRGQTGCINIVDEDGTLIESGIMPSDNVDRPVRLIRVSDGAVMWQGFLSCETYSQAYTSRPNDVTLNVNSVLAALKSVHFGNENVGLMSIRQIIAKAFVYITAECGFPAFNNIYIPIESYAAISKLLNSSIFFKEKKLQKRWKESEGLPMYDILTMICQFMGWVIRESNGNIYIQHVGSRNGYHVFNYVNFVSNSNAHISTELSTKDMSTFDYMSDGHQKERSMGAYSVGVRANLKEYKIDINVPDFPYGPMFEDAIHLSTGKYLYSYISRDGSAYNHINMKYSAVDMNVISGTIYSQFPSSLLDAYYSLAYVAAAQSALILSAVNRNNHYRFVGGSFYSRLALENEQRQDPKYQDGIYCSLLPGLANTDTTMDEILSISGILPIRLRNGFLRISADCIMMAASAAPGFSPMFGDMQTLTTLTVGMRIGNKYWNGTEWTNTPSTFQIQIDGNHVKRNWEEGAPYDKQDAYVIPVNDELSGVPYFLLYPQSDNLGINRTTIGTTTIVGEVFFSSLQVDCFFSDTSRLSDEGTNEYTRVLGGKFSKEVMIDTDIATDNFNEPSPSMLMDDENTPTTSIQYASGAGRPEEVLLDRLVSYYGEPKRKVIIDVSPQETSLSMMLITGYPDSEGNTKTYLPLSESRDWKMGVSTIKCFEVPDPS